MMSRPTRSAGRAAFHQYAGNQGETGGASTYYARIPGAAGGRRARLLDVAHALHHVRHVAVFALGHLLDDIQDLNIGALRLGAPGQVFPLSGEVDPFQVVTDVGRGNGLLLLAS